MSDFIPAAMFAEGQKAFIRFDEMTAEEWALEGFKMDSSIKKADPEWTPRVLDSEVIDGFRGELAEHVQGADFGKALSATSAKMLKFFAALPADVRRDPSYQAEVATGLEQLDSHLDARSWVSELATATGTRRKRAIAKIDRLAG